MTELHCMIALQVLPMLASNANTRVYLSRNFPTKQLSLPQFMDKGHIL